MICVLQLLFTHHIFQEKRRIAKLQQQQNTKQNNKPKYQKKRK